ncbi:MAG: SdrD B-like domain-containing protein [Vicingaceae bacterium]
MKRVLLLFAILSLSAMLKAGAPDLFYFVADGNNRLYSVDRVSGVVTNIGALGVGNVEAIAYYPIPGNNQLFAANGGEFGEINIATGAYTSISDIDAAGPMNGAIGAQSVDDVDAMMLDGQTFKIWAAQRNSPNDLLFQIDPITGQVIRSAFGPGVDYVVVSGPGINVDVDDIGIDPTTGRMYASNNDGGSSDNLIEINKFNATYSIVTALGEDDVEGLAFHNDGRLYGSEGDADRMSEFSITTGVASNQITLAGGDVEALAALVADANTLSGTVFNDDDLDGVLDGGESGVQGVTLYLYFDQDGDGQIDPEDTRLQTTTSDVNGDYNFYYASTADLLVSTEFSSYPGSSALTTDNIETASFTDNVNFGEVDANNNFGVGTGPDCDGDGLPNFYEAALNSDADPILDSCDLDSDNDGILDSVEGIEDFDNDGIPNYRDRDSDDDGIPDAIEANQGAEPTGYTSTEGNVAGTDTDGNGIVDNLETAAGSGIMVAPLPDSDNDGKPDYLDLDSDNDGILDIVEAGGEDSDQDGQVDGLIDTDSNGLDDRIESTPLDIPNTDESFENTNGLTNLPNYIDIDSDSDGIDDTREGYSTANYAFPTLLTDTDSDGIIDFWDVSAFSSPIVPYDRDSDDTPDYLDDDSDNDGVSDLIEGNDADGDGVVDVTLSGVDDDNNGLDDALDGLCGQETVYATVLDYGEEDVSDGSVDDGSSDLELPNESENQIVGVRFGNVDVNQGASITSAFVQFETDELSSGEISIVIEGELATNSAAITGADDNISDRTRTAASEIWSPEDWDQVNEAGDDQRTVDISSIIQEIVNQGGWSSGNSLTLIFTGPDGNTRTAETDPLLIINTDFDATPTLDFTAGDYAEEDNSDGSIDLGSSDLELVNESENQTVGVLFAGVTLDQGQVVTSAYIQFETDETDAGSIDITIEGELTNSSVAFTSTNSDVSNRTTTTNSVTWSPPDWNVVGEAGAAQQTPDLTNIVQEIVDQGGWSNGNNMTFIFTGPAGNTRTAENDPVLVIETSASFSICASSVAHQDFDSDGEDDFRDTDDDEDGISTFSEIPDADGSGQPDYLEFDGDECGVGSILTSYTDDYGGTEQSQTGVTNPGNLTGTPDGSVTEFTANFDEYVMDFGQVYPAGYKYVITWSEAASQAGTAEIVLAESEDNSTFNGRLDNPTTNSTTLFNDTITALFDFRYIRFQLLNSASSTDFEIDAVGVLEPNCEDDADDDNIPDNDDIDDDNDGVLDVNEADCTPVASAPSGAVVDESGTGGALTLINDGDLSANQGIALNNAGEYVIVDLGGDIPTNTVITFTLWKNNDNNKTLRFAQLPNSAVNLGGGTNPQTIDDVSIASGSSVTSFNYTLSAETQYIQIEMSSRDGGRIEVVEATVGPYSDCVDIDTDGDGVSDRLDLDSDNDGIPDITEAGGTDTDTDGRVDNATDTDGDGWANTFDSDDGGTALDDDDTDGDGLENRIDLDADNDGIADIVEAGGEDTDGDGQADDNTDTDGDGLADTFDNDNLGTPLPIEDEDGDGIENYLDLDSDSDGISDNVEGQTTAAFLAPLGSDGDNDGWDDRYDSDNGGTAITLSNNEGFGNPDYLDDDSDGDGFPDWIEGFDDDEDGDAQNDLETRGDNFETAAGNPLFYVNSDDTDTDGLPDWLEDDDADNIPNFLDPDSGFYHDTDGDGNIDLYDSDNNGVDSNTPDSDGDGEYDFRDTDDEISLPIELAYFTVEKDGERVKLMRKTYTEINNDYFIVERSLDGVEYTPIVQTDGAGNSYTPVEYLEYDLSPEQGINYYRLSQTDYDGTRTDFPIKWVEFSGVNLEAIIYPNPAANGRVYLSLKNPIHGLYSTEVRDVNGSLIIKKEFKIEDETLFFEMEFLRGRRLASGVYYLHLTTSEINETLKFIVR